MNDEISITKPQLIAVLARWEQNFRDGKTETDAQRASQPVQQVARKSGEWLWNELKLEGTVS